MRLKYFLSVLLLFSNLIASAQPPDWKWAKSYGGNRNDVSKCITLDKYGNIYISGIYNSDSITFSNFTLNNSNPVMYGDIFITKLDSLGNVLWAKSAGGSDYDYVYGMVTDSHGCTYITGTFTQDSITFDTITLHTVGGNDIFIAKYDSSGNILWAKSGGSGMGDYSYSITCDKEDNIYITGAYGFDTFIIDNDTLPNLGVSSPNTSTDMFILKINQTGNILWVKSVNGNHWEGGSDIVSDTNNNIYVSGMFDSDSISLDSITLFNIGATYDNNVFIAKYNALGEIQWAKNIYKSLGGFSAKIVTDIFNNIYLSGSFSDSTITFGNTTLINTVDTASDMFVVKYDSMCNFLWAKSAGGYRWEYIQSIVSDINGDISIIGGTNSPFINFGNTTDSTGSSDLGSYTVKYDSFGNFLWVKNSQGTNKDITNDNFGNIYITGGFSDSIINFDSITVYNSNLYWSDIFIAKLSGLGTSINTVDLKKPITIYPNPSSGRVNIDANDIISTEIFSLDGKPVRTYKNRNKIDISDLPDGMYFISVQTKTKRYYSKIIKME